MNEILISHPATAIEWWYDVLLFPLSFGVSALIMFVLRRILYGPRAEMRKRLRTEMRKIFSAGTLPRNYVMGAGHPYRFPSPLPAGLEPSFGERVRFAARRVFATVRRGFIAWILDEGKICRMCRSYKRHDIEQRWAYDKILKMDGVPGAPGKCTGFVEETSSKALSNRTTWYSKATTRGSVTSSPP